MWKTLGEDKCVIKGSKAITLYIVLSQSVHANINLISAYFWDILGIYLGFFIDADFWMVNF